MNILAAPRTRRARKRVESLLPALGGEDPEARLKAIESLVALGAEWESCIASLTRHPNPAVRASALKALGEIGAQAATPESA